MIFISGLLGSIFQIGAMGQVLYYARAFQTGEAFEVLGYHIEPRSVDFFILVMAGLLIFLLISSVLIYYSRSRILELACSYETFCSKKIFSTVCYHQKICSPGLLSLYDNQTLLKLAGRNARFCGRVLRRLIMLVQPSFTFVIALGALFYINSPLTAVILFITGISLFFHYRNNLKAVSSFEKMEHHTPGAKRERYRILQAARGIDHVDGEFLNWMDDSFDEGEIRDNLEAYRGRFQTLEDSRFINDVFLAILLFMVVLILGGNAIIHRANWGALVVYLVALRYCMVHLKKTLLSLTSINRFYPTFAGYLSFIDSLDLNKEEKGFLRRRHNVRAQGSPFENSFSSRRIENGDTVALVSPFDFDFGNIPMYIECLLGCKKGFIRRILASMQVIAESNGYWNGLSLREAFHFAREYNVTALHQDLQGLMFPGVTIKQLPHDLDRTLSRDEWDRIKPEIRYSLGLLSVIHSTCLWVVIDEKILRYLSDRNAKHLLGRLKEKITLIVFDRQLHKVGAYGEKTVAVTDGQNLIGLGNTDWFESQKRPIEESLRSVKQPPDRAATRREEDAEEEDDDELDDDF